MKEKERGESNKHTQKKTIQNKKRDREKTQFAVFNTKIMKIRKSQHEKDGMYKSE